MTTLYLSASERPLFEKIAGSLQEGWVLEDETGTYSDTPQKRAIRLSLVRIHDPVLLEVREAAYKAKSVEDVAGILQDFDLKNVDEDDIAELFFALGTDVISGLIAYVLSNAKTDSDIEGAVALSLIRHTIYESFAPAH